MSGDGWRVELSRSARKSLGHLEDKTALRILDGLEDLGGIDNPLSHKDVRALEGKLRSFYRFRVGEYRVIFELESGRKRIGILAIVTRSQAYR
jgi:mRNA interferase RelE/StbE